MLESEIISFVRGLGCCDLCCLRYIGLKNSKVYENPEEFFRKIKQQETPTNTAAEKNQDSETKTLNTDIPESSTNNTQCSENYEGGLEISEPPCKKRKTVCVSCLGILQEENWGDCIDKVKRALEKKRYKCATFACGLSAPIAVILRERAILAAIKQKYTDYDETKMPALKESWKWSFCDKLSDNLNMVLDSGAVAPLLITLAMDYDDDLLEMHLLCSNVKTPNRRWCERKCDDSSPSTLVALLSDKLSPAQSPAFCKEVLTEHVPVYIGGRYIKLSRELPQTPWVLNGVRMMESSVQDICFQPIADLFLIEQSSRDSRMKLMSAGREDVDVRCLGNGRPFCVEVSDPRFVPTVEDLDTVAAEIAKDGRVVVKNLQVVTKDDLTVLKQGEETKCKTYEALCIKLSHSKTDKPNGHTNGETQITVTEQDIEKLNSFTNTDDISTRIKIRQKTPIRVLHRRPLLARPRIIHSLEAFKVTDRPELFRLKVVTSAGTYVKEWVHGELGRTAPSVKDILNAHVDILALDVTDIHLKWP